MDDLEELASVLAPEPSREQLVNRLEETKAGYRSMLVAVLDGVVIGTVSYRHQPETGPVAVRLFALDVGARFRRQGVGRRLVEAVEDEAARVGASVVTLEVATANTAAIGLYKRLGYLREGDPFTNRWNKHTADGTVEINERSVRMVKRTGL